MFASTAAPGISSSVTGQQQLQASNRPNGTDTPASTSVPADSDHTAVNWDCWPDGDFTCQLTWDEFTATNQLSEHWANRTTGTHAPDDLVQQFGKVKATVRSCMGVISCTNEECLRFIRPQTRKRGILKQIRALCECEAPLEHHSCSVTSRLYKFASGVIYKHSGTHGHARPARKLHLTPTEHEELRNLVIEHPKSGPLALLVGVSTRPSAAKISTVLANQDRLKADRRAIKAGLSSGGDRFITEYANFCRDHPGFVISSHFGVVTVVSMQSKFMVSQLIKDDVIPGTSDLDGLSGLVSDAAHKYWLQRNHLLIISSVYSPLLKCWAPGLFSFSNGASANHYELHFIALFDSIACRAKEYNIALEMQHFSGVCDLIPQTYIPTESMTIYL